MKCLKHQLQFTSENCYECNRIEYDRAIQENTQGKNPPHNLKELEKSLQIKNETTSPEIKISHTPSPDLKAISDYKDKIRYGYKTESEL